GDGTFQSSVNYSAGAGPDHIAVGDFNGDGRLDLAVANGGSNSVTVLRQTTLVIVNPFPDPKVNIVVYSQPIPFPQFSPVGLLDGDRLDSLGVTVTCRTTATAGSPVGTYPVTCDGPSAAGQYVFIYQPGTLTITPAPLTITVDNATRVLNTPNPTFTATYGGFVNGDTPSSLRGTLSCTSPATTTSPVGSYPITCLGQSSTNYTITFVPGTLKVGYATTGFVNGSPGHQILTPINADGTSVYKQGRTIPAQFRVGDA